MFESWPSMVFGWPSAIVGASFLLLGLITKRAWVIAVGAIIAAGFCLYLAMNPFPFRLLGLLALAGNFAAALAVRRKAVLLGASLVAPFFLCSAYLIYAVRST